MQAFCSTSLRVITGPALTTIILAPASALAHWGHLGELAGHGHWIAAGLAAAAAGGGGAVAQHHTYIHGFETELCETPEKWQTCGEREARLYLSRAGCACKKNNETHDSHDETVDTST